MAKKILNGLDLTNQRIVNLADPSGLSDAATKQYVDLYVNGISFKAPVRAATTGNITLTAPQTIDGVAVVAGDRVLVKNQTTASANGIYVVAAGAWTRSTDADSSAEVVSGMTVFVTEGTVAADKQYSLLTDGAITVGTTSLAFGQTAATGATYTAGNGISLGGNAITAVAKAGGSLAVDSGGIYIDPTGPLAARRYAANVTAGSTSAVMTHNLNTLDVIVSVYEVSGGLEVEADVALTSANSITLTFAVAPTAAQYRVVVLA